MLLLSIRLPRNVIRLTFYDVISRMDAFYKELYCGTRFLTGNSNEIYRGIAILLEKKCTLTPETVETHYRE